MSNEYAGLGSLLISTDPEWDNSGEWEDLRFPGTGPGADTSTGRLYMDYTTEMTLAFAVNARYSNEPWVNIVQFPHGWRQGSGIKPHLHWLQKESNVPNWMVRRRWVPKNGAPTSWVNSAWNSNAYTYSAGTLHQITGFLTITRTSATISDILQIILYRDSANASGLFAGADPYTVDAEVLEMDCHVQMETMGSPEEYWKVK